MLIIFDVKYNAFSTYYLQKHYVKNSQCLQCKCLGTCNVLTVDKYSVSVS